MLHAAWRDAENNVLLKMTSDDRRTMRRIDGKWRCAPSHRLFNLCQLAQSAYDKYAHMALHELETDRRSEYQRESEAPLSVSDMPLTHYWVTDCPVAVTDGSRHDFKLQR